MQRIFKGYKCINSTLSKTHTLTINVSQCLYSCKTTYGYKFTFANCTINVYTATKTYRIMDN